MLVENWTDDEADALEFVGVLAPPDLMDLFPQRIGARLGELEDPSAGLLDATDVRLYRHAVRGGDPEAAATLLRLEMLDRAEVFRALPAEILLELTHELCPVRLQPGEVIIWQGETSDDVYLLVSGELDAVVGEGEGARRVGTIRPGEVVGEMAFFTRAPRAATVRANGPAECFVLPATDLRLFAQRHPDVLVHMARPLARRLDRMQREGAG